MTQEEMGDFLKEVYETHKANGDVKSVIARYEKLYKYVYFYSDVCAKSILAGDDGDLSLVMDLVNAALRLIGSDCISNAKLENPAIGGGLVHKDIEHDILLSVPREDSEGKELPSDRIGLEFQHRGYDVYNNRLLFYVSRGTVNSLKKGDFYDMIPNVQLISFQMFDYKPWNISRNYVHTAWYQDDEQDTFSKQQTVTIVEVGKFLKHADTDFANDHSRLAQWLRAIDFINNNGDFSAFVVDPIFSRLQKRAELSTFVPEQFIKEGEYMRDDAEVLAYIARQEERKKVAAEFSAELNAKNEALNAKNEALNAKNAELDAKIAENLAQAAKIASLEAQIAALTGK